MKARAQHWSDPVKDKQPSETTLNTKGDLSQLRDVLRKVVKKDEQQPKGGK